MAKKFENNLTQECLDLELTLVNGETINVSPIGAITARFVIDCVEAFNQIEEPVVKEIREMADDINARSAKLKNECDDGKNEEISNRELRKINKEIANYEYYQRKRNIDIIAEELNFVYGMGVEWWITNNENKVLYQIVTYVGEQLEALSKKPTR